MMRIYGFNRLILIVGFAASLCGCESKSKKTKSDSLFEYLILEYEIKRLNPSQGLLSSYEYQQIESQVPYQSLRARHDFDFEAYQKQPICKFDTSRFNAVSFLTDEEVTVYHENSMLLDEKKAFFEIDQPLFNSDSSLALVSLIFKCGRYCSYSQLTLFTFENDEWRIEDELSGVIW